MKVKYFNGRETVTEEANFGKKKEKDTDKVFTAYCKKLLRELVELKNFIETNNKLQAIVLLDELISDTKTDIEN